MKTTTLFTVGLSLSLTSLLSAADWTGSEWISVKEARVHEAGKPLGLAAAGTSWFARSFTNKGEITSAKWSVTGLGVFDVYVNGARIGDDFLKPGFTHNGKTKYAFTYDVTAQLKREAGASNALAAEVSAGWWRDRICSPGPKDYWGKKSAFRGELEITYADGTTETIGTRAADWQSGVAGGVIRAGIFDGEVFDARVHQPTDGVGLTGTTEVNTEFQGEILPTAGAEVTLRRDLAMTRGPYALKKGEKLVVDFGQNCAAVPEIVAKAKAGTFMRILPAEMLNDADKGQRGSDGPKGSVYRANLRTGRHGMLFDYMFKGEGVETYHPRFTYFGYRYLQIEATEDVEITSVTSIPVTSVKKEHETGSLEVGDKDLNQFISNVRWGLLSNYLSVPTDCPQRNERLGWTADTQIFAEAGSYNADTRAFFRKWMRDMRDCQDKRGGYPSVAPIAQFANEPFKFGWADAGVIVPYVVWRHFGDTQIVEENWDAMMRFMKTIDEKKYNFEDDGLPFPIYSDWLSFEKYEVSGKGWNKYKGDPDARKFRCFLAGCYWLYDAEGMAKMGAAIGKTEEAAWCAASAERARAYLKENFLEADGRLLTLMRDMQTPSAFALYLDLLEGEAKTATVEWLVKSIRDNNTTMRTGFLGTLMLMDALAKEGRFDVAYDLLLQHNFPGWLYSVDQGATTVWERWNSYTLERGFGDVSMNSFNHYAYGAVVAWMYKHAAGIASCEEAPGFKKIILAPKPEKRLGHVKASYQSAAGLITSAWRYEGDDWVWEFTIPEGATGDVTLPNGEKRAYAAGSHRVVSGAAKAAPLR